MPRKPFLIAGLCALMCASAANAASPPKSLAAAYVVAANNADFQSENCGRAKADPQRPDRRRLARLVGRMSDPNALYAFGSGQANALVLAVLADDVALLDKLYARGGSLDTPALQSLAMYIAAESDGPSMIQALHRHGVKPDSHAKGHFTPLMIAAWNDRPESVDALLGLGANPNLLSASGNSALAGAVFCRDQGMVDTLLKHGARPDHYIHQIEKRKGTHLIADAGPVNRAAHRD